jgi:ribose 5-phosphate isomerase B
MEARMKIVMGSDHVGYEMKLALSEHIKSKGHEVTDIGANNGEPSEYPTFGRLAAEEVASGNADRAVLICGTGFGISLAANTVRGVRCVSCTEPYTAMLSRKHNDSRALALGARVIGLELAKMMVDVWLGSDFEGGRHAERVKMISEMENG